MPSRELGAQAGLQPLSPTPELGRATQPSAGAAPGPSLRSAEGGGAHGQGPEG